MFIIVLKRFNFKGGTSILLIDIIQLRDVSRRANITKYLVVQKHQESRLLAPIHFDANIP